MGQLSAVSAGAWLLAGLASGSIVDRVDRRRLLVACDLGQGLAYATVPLAWALRGPSLPWLFVVAAVGAVLGNLHRAAAGAAVQRLVSREKLLDANAAMHVAGAFTGCVGPLVAGLACARFGAVTGVAVDAASFLVAAVATTTIRTSLDPDPAVVTGGLLDDLRVGLRFLGESAALRAPLAIAAVAAPLLAGRDNLVVYHLRRDLGLGEAAVGATFAAASVGSLVGASLARRLRDRVGFAASWLGAGAVMGAALAGVGAVTSLVAVASLAAVLAACETVRGIHTVTLRQEVTPAHLLGRVTAVWWPSPSRPTAPRARPSRRTAASSCSRRSTRRCWRRSRRAARTTPRGAARARRRASPRSCASLRPASTSSRSRGASPRSGACAHRASSRPSASWGTGCSTCGSRPTARPFASSSTRATRRASGARATATSCAPAGPTPRASRSPPTGSSSRQSRAVASSTPTSTPRRARARGKARRWRPRPTPSSRPAPNGCSCSKRAAFASSAGTRTSSTTASPTSTTGSPSRPTPARPRACAWSAATPPASSPTSTPTSAPRGVLANPTCSVGTCWR